MKSLILSSALALVLFSSCSQGGGLSWRRVSMDASRTGVTACTATNQAEALGSLTDSVYVSPSGREFLPGSATYAAAKSLIGAQASMADVKKVIAQSTREMSREEYPESLLGDWYIDALMSITAKKAGKKVDFGIVNFGGIRVDMPKGDVLKDDIVSMFPFKNNLCYLELKGSDIRALLEQLAATKWQVVGGARCVVKGGKLESAEIGGKPLDDNRTYGVATINFVLSGGDDLYVARNSRNLKMFPGYIIDVMLPYVESLTAQGKPIDSELDGRIKIID